MSLHRSRGNGFRTGKDSLEDTFEIQTFYSFARDPQCVDRSIVLVVEAVLKATGVSPRSPNLLFRPSRVDIKR